MGFEKITETIQVEKEIGTRLICDRCGTINPAVIPPRDTRLLPDNWRQTYAGIEAQPFLLCLPCQAAVVRFIRDGPY